MAKPSSLGCESLIAVLTMWRSSILKDENGGYQTITEDLEMAEPSSLGC